MLLPLAAVFFAFVISVLIDVRNKQFNSRNMIDHSTRLGIYLASIAMLELLAKTEPSLAHYVIYIALTFAGSEVLNTVMLIKKALGANDPINSALNLMAGTLAQQAQTTQAAQQSTTGGVPIVDATANNSTNSTK